jgi:hypothetical protein
MMLMPPAFAIAITITPLSLTLPLSPFSFAIDYFIIFATPFRLLRISIDTFRLRHYDAAFDYAAERFLPMP